MECLIFLGFSFLSKQVTAFYVIISTILIILFLSSNVYCQELILDNINSSIKWTGKEITTKTHYGSL